MTYLEGVDYFVRVVPFPNTAAAGCAVSNGDGTFTIYVNAHEPSERQRAAVLHELEHLRREHFYRDIPASEAEAEAHRAVPYYKYRAQMREAAN